MGLRTLDITVLSATDVKKKRTAVMFSKKNIYAIVTILGESQTTSVDTHCGVNPNWNHLIRFNIDETAAMQNQLTIVYTIKSTGGCFGDSVLGQVFVPVKDILLQNINRHEEQRPQTQSYSITTPGGRAKGVLNVSYKFGPQISANAAANNPGMAYPPPQQDYVNPTAAPQGGWYPPPDANKGAMAYPPPGYPQPQAAYPPPGGYPPPNMGYAAYPGSGYAPVHGPVGMNYPPPPPGVGMGYASSGGYAAPQQQSKKKRMAAGLGLGVGAGLLGGLAGGMALSAVASGGDYGGDGDYGDYGGGDFGDYGGGD